MHVCLTHSVSSSQVNAKSSSSCAQQKYKDIRSIEDKNEGRGKRERETQNGKMYCLHSDYPYIMAENSVKLYVKKEKHPLET